MSNLDLEKQQVILERAQKLALQNNSLFATQRSTYLQQHQLLRDDASDYHREQQEKLLQNGINNSIQKCTDLQQQIEKTRKEIQGLFEKNKQLSRLQYEEMLLRAEVEQTEDSPVDSTEPDHMVTLAEYEQELRLSVQQHKELISDLHNKKAKLAEEIKRQEEILEERKIIHTSLTERISNSPTKKGKKESKYTQLEAEISQLRKDAEQLKSGLKWFLNKAYPLNEALASDQEDEENGKPQYKYDSLKSLIQDLLAKTDKNPDDPYIPIIPRYWPGYIELVLRSGIAEKHPKDNRLIKLVSFHK